MAGEILCVGEVLWDALPDGLFLGGAPFNVACHLRALGEPAVFSSRVGKDELGREILRRMERHGLGTEWMQVDPDLPTGFVAVTLDPEGSPRFEILAPSAWDALEPKNELLRLAASSRALVHGSLAQRAGASRGTIRKLLEASAFRVFDVNLRPPFDRREVVEEGLDGAGLVKLNEDEWKVLSGWLRLPEDPRRGSEALAERCRGATVCITRGPRGAVLRHRGGWLEHPGFPVETVDAVGAGDAFLASLLQGLLAGKEPAGVLADACALGAFVATRRGATPPLDPAGIARIRGSRG